MGYAVIVSFVIKPAMVEHFLPLMTEQAINSKALEPGCLVFDVWTRTDTPHHVTLYEVYTDAKSFDLHLGSDHFKRFDEVTRQMIDEKTVTLLDQRLDG